MNMRKTFVIVSSLAALMGCNPTRTVATETEKELCVTWGESLPTRSRQDTPETQSEISDSYEDFGLACPDHVDLIPK